SLALRSSRILRSSARSLPKSFFSANHLEFQSLLTERRRPIGFVFWPILLLVGQNDFDVTTAFEDGAGGTAGLGGEKLDGGGRAGDGALDAEMFGVHVAVSVFVKLEILGVGHGGFQGFGDDARAFAGNDGQGGLGVRGGHALNLADDLAHFLRRHPNIVRNGLDFHNCFYLASALAVWAPCFLNVRVSENSPNRWPTMFSVTNTGLNTLPLCTLNVCPTNSGVIIERRDHVLIGFFEPVAFSFVIFSSKWVSTNGPFLIERPINRYLCFIGRPSRRTRIKRFDSLRLLRVFLPFVMTPQGVTGCPPPEVLPAPPPIGWSTGFFATARL